jgi:hypothetical protein
MQAAVIVFDNEVGERPACIDCKAHVAPSLAHWPAAFAATLCAPYLGGNAETDTGERQG